MRTIPLLSLLGLLTSACCLDAQTNLPSLITEHADIRINHNPTAIEPLSLAVRNDDQGVDYETNQIVLVALESSEVTLPPGTPFGEAGEPLWVLPQSRLPGQAVLFLGFSAAGAGMFNGPLAVRLTKLEGPGRFYVWQADEFGGLSLKMNSADGIDSSDKVEVLAAGHDHYNWGFSTSGVYGVTFQASGTRVGETQPIVSPEATIVFHVRPLGVVTPFALWQKAHWLQGTDASTNGPAADPDSDGLSNALEYASNLDPNSFSTNGRPEFSFVTNGRDTYGAFTFTQVKPATDLIYEPAARAQLSSSSWEGMTNRASLFDEGYIETVTLRDSTPISASSSRFYQFRVTLSDP
ncbi:MAG: choice-of-anchor M domain-containing protein [Verrucomicrobia bacterium]|nr:choice-of-anchor M domain-containing protein [Verrucomicrobiota bacterium]